MTKQRLAEAHARPISNAQFSGRGTRPNNSEIRTAFEAALLIPVLLPGVDTNNLPEGLETVEWLDMTANRIGLLRRAVERVHQCDAVQGIVGCAVAAAGESVAGGSGIQQLGQYFTGSRNDQEISNVSGSPPQCSDRACATRKPSKG